MRKLPVITVLVALAVLVSCRGGHRVIPARVMVQIYSDMFMADQWILEHTTERRTADTTLFYEPIFRKYGYTTEDYQNTLHYYMGHPEKYEKIISRVSANLEERKKCLEKQQFSDQSEPED